MLKRIASQCKVCVSAISQWFASRRFLLFASVAMLFPTMIMASMVVHAPVTIQDMAHTVDSTSLALGGIISDIALVAGIGFLLASFFKFDQHKKNPTQIPVSQPLTLLLIGAALCLLPTILPLVQTAVFGSQAQRGAVGSTTILSLIGS